MVKRQIAGQMAIPLVPDNPPADYRRIVGEVIMTNSMFAYRRSPNRSTYEGHNTSGI